MVLVVERCRECGTLETFGGEAAEKLYKQGRTVELEYCVDAEWEDVEGEIGFGSYVVYDILVYVEGDETHVHCQEGGC